MPGTFRACATSAMRACAAGEPASPGSRTSATMLGAAAWPVASKICSRAVTASACGSSKSLSEPNSENTGTASTAATTTIPANAARIARRRRKIRDATRDSLTVRGRSLLPLGPRRSPLVLAHDLTQVERRDQVQQHAVREEVPCLVERHAGQLGHVAHELAVAVAHGLLELRVGGDRVGLHLEAQGIAIGQEPLHVCVAHRHQPLLLRQAGGGLLEHLPD